MQIVCGVALASCQCSVPPRKSWARGLAAIGRSAAACDCVVLFRRTGKRELGAWLQKIKVLAQRFAVQLIDLGPARGFAELKAGDVEERVAFLHDVDSSADALPRAGGDCRASAWPNVPALGHEIRIFLFQLRNRRRRQLVANLQPIRVRKLIAVEMV